MLIGLTLAVLIHPYIRLEHRRTMLIIAALCLTLIGQHYMDTPSPSASPGSCSEP